MFTGILGGERALDCGYGRRMCLLASSEPTMIAIQSLAAICALASEVRYMLGTCVHVTSAYQWITVEGPLCMDNVHGPAAGA